MTDAALEQTEAAGAEGRPRQTVRRHIVRPGRIALGLIAATLSVPLLPLDPRLATEARQ